MTALAAVLMVGGLLFAILFAVGAVVLFGMLIHAEVSYVRSHPVEKIETAPETHAIPSRTAPDLGKLSA